MKKPNLINQFKRWRLSHVELLGQVDGLQKENARLRGKLAVLQQAKDRAEKQAEGRKREKEALRTKLAGQKKEMDLRAAQIEELGDKISELRAEVAKLSRKGKK
jgi:chromosome segregation ATPase